MEYIGSDGKAGQLWQTRHSFGPVLLDPVNQGSGGVALVLQSTSTACAARTPAAAGDFSPWAMS
jgi:hypothetical protein